MAAAAGAGRCIYRYSALRSRGANRQPGSQAPAHKQWRPLAPRCGDRVLHGRVAPRRDPAPHSQALRAKTPRPTAQRSAPRPRAPRPGGSTHFRRSSRFRYLTAFQGLNHRAPGPRWLHRLRRLGSTCARVRAPVQKGCVGCARARAEGVRGLRARPCSRGTCTARAPLQKGCVGCARAHAEGVRMRVHACPTYTERATAGTPVAERCPLRHPGDFTQHLRVAERASVWAQSPRPAAAGPSQPRPWASGPHL